MYEWNEKKIGESRLVAHCGGNIVGYNDLQALPNPEPLGTRHAPQRFDAVVDLVARNLSRLGFAIADSAFALNKKATQMHGLLECRFDDAAATIFGLRYSTDQSFPLSVASGERLFVCDNLAFYGAKSITLRSTPNDRALASRDFCLDWRTCANG
jgi:hypothetical protein